MSGTDRLRVGVRQNARHALELFDNIVLHVQLTGSCGLVGPVERVGILTSQKALKDTKEICSFPDA